MQLAITTHHSLDTSFSAQMKDKPRIFLPGTPEFTWGFLFRGIKFRPRSMSDLNIEQLPWQKHSASRVTEQESSWRLQVGKRRKYQPWPCRIMVSWDGEDLPGHQIQPFMRARHNHLQSGLQKVFFEVCLPL